MKSGLYILFICILVSSNVIAQNWTTTGGNMQKNGISKLTGPVTQNLYWSITNSGSSVWGNTILTWGNKFATSRVILSPYIAVLELRDLTTGGLIWQKQITDSSVMYTVGFNEDAVYANDYKTGKLYALNISDGSVKWFINSSMFGGNTGILFAPNGDVIDFGRRLNKINGQVVWTNNYPIPIGPDGSYCIYGNTYYHWTGTINTSKTLIAIDINNGQTKYTSAAIPGGSGQQNPLRMGPDGTIYITRDQGGLFAFTDNGSAFNQLWTIPQGFLVRSFAKDGKIYAVDQATGRIIRINPANGNLIDSTQNSYSASISYTMIDVGADSTVYVSTGETGAGRYVAFTPDLQTTKWTLGAPYNYYSGPALGKEGVLLMTWAGTTITAYKTALTNLKPVADFYAGNNIVVQFSSTNFFDLSSYGPTSWQWTFSGSATPASTQQNPQNIIYNTVGTYDVKLVASNSFGTDTLIRAGYITVVPFIGINQIGNEIPGAYKLYQNYPNPFNPQTNIRFEVPPNRSLQTLKLKIYNSQGREIKTIVNQTLPAGIYEVKWDGSNYPSGVYFYRLSVSGPAEGFEETKKMIFIK